MGRKEQIEQDGFIMGEPSEMIKDIYQDLDTIYKKLNKIDKRLDALEV